MSDVMLAQVNSLLTNLARDIQVVGDNTHTQFSRLMEAMDDIAAHMLAMQGIIAAMLPTNPVDPAVVKEWIGERTDAVGGDGSKAKALANLLITGKLEE
jgi:hypothetical protein